MLEIEAYTFLDVLRKEIRLAKIERMRFASVPKLFPDCFNQTLVEWIPSSD